MLDDSSSESSKDAVGSETRSSTVHVSAQRPNTMRDEPPVKQESEDLGENTSDEDQEDLPYDGDLKSPYFNHTDGGHAATGGPDPPSLSELLQDDTKTKCDDSREASVDEAPPDPVPADIHRLLLRHFSEQELLQSGRLIEAETLPEVSLLESVDDSAFSLAPAHKSSALQSNKSASEGESLEVKTEKEANDGASADQGASSSGCSNQTSGDVSADVSNQEDAEEDDPVPRAPLVRARSFSEMKYGQGQVHYPLPDFSKVAPKVMFSKRPSGPVKSGPRCPPNPMHRAQSSPGMLEVISRVLEDSPEKPYVFTNCEQSTQPALVHHLQVGIRTEPSLCFLTFRR